MELPLETTTLGAFPKPNYVPVRDWFDLARKTGGMNTAEKTRQYSTDAGLSSVSLLEGVPSQPLRLCKNIR
jgi:hypothetical protein